MSRDMFEDPRSHEADDLALQAELLERRGSHADARALYRRAAELEEALAREAPLSTPRVRGVLVISAVSLWSAAGALPRAMGLADEFLADPEFPAIERDSLAKLTVELRQAHDAADDGRGGRAEREARRCAGGVGRRDLM